MRYELSLLHCLFALLKAHKPINEHVLARETGVTYSKVDAALGALEQAGLVWRVSGGPRLTMLGLAAATVTRRLRGVRTRVQRAPQLAPRALPAPVAETGPLYAQTPRWRVAVPRAAEADERAA